MKSRASLAALAFCTCCANPAFSEGGGAPATAAPVFAFVDEEVSLRVAGAEGPVAAAVSVVTPDGFGPRRAGLLEFRDGVASIRPLAEGIHVVRLGDAAQTEVRFLAMDPPPPPAPGALASRLPRAAAKLAAGGPFTILALGDSVTATGDYHEMLARMLARAFGHPAVVAVRRAHAGCSIDATLRTLESETRGLRPDLALLMYGLNDQGAGMPLPDFLATAEAIADDLDARFGADTVTVASTPRLGGYWPGLPDAAFRTRSWGLAQARAALARGRVHADGFDALWPDRAEGLHQAEQALAPLYPRSWDAPFSTLLETAGRGDGTHPNALGHLLLAKAVYAALCLPAPEPDPLEITAESAWTDAGLATTIRLRNASDRPVAGTLAAFAPEDAVLDAAGGDPSGAFDLAPGATFARTVLWRGTADPATALFEAAPRRALRDGVPAVIAGLRIDGSFRTRVVEAPFRDGSAAFLPDRFEVPAGTRAVTLRARFGATEETVEVALPERPDEVFRLPVFRARSAAGAPDGARNAAAELVGHRPATALPGEIVVDGDLSEWAGRRFVPLGLPCQARTSRGVSDPRAAPSDLFPELSFFAGREALHVAMRAAGAAPGDGLTLFLDPRAPEAFGTAGSYVWAGIGLKEDGAVEVSRGETSPPGPGTVGRWRRTPEGTLEAEWSIPWEWAGLDAFPASGRLGLSVIYRQGRPPHARLSWVESYFEWTPLHYGELRLVPNAAAESGDALPWLLRVEP